MCAPNLIWPLLKPHLFAQYLLWPALWPDHSEPTIFWQNVIFVHFCHLVEFLSETREPIVAVCHFQSVNRNFMNLSKRPWHWVVLCGQKS